MRSPTPRPLENVLAMVGAALVAGTLLPWRFHVACAFGVVAVVALLATLRLRAHGTKKTQRRAVDVYARIDRMRADRKARYNRPNRHGRRG